MRISFWFDQLLQDARCALRTLRNNSGLSAVVVLTLALGISLNTAVFSVFNAVVLRPVAYPSPDRLLWLSTMRARLAVVTEDFWDLTGARPAVGRLPTVGEQDAVVLSHGFAQRWFAGDGGAIGRTVTLEGQRATVVGVLPADFRFHRPAPPWPGFRRPRWRCGG
jgi:putative ABC transport system permease protein